jgi:DNA polymerase-3 subunit delta
LESGEPDSLILWTISKEMRLLMQLYEQPQNALQLGIWKTKISLYQQALRRLNPHIFNLATLLLRIDAAIKGLSQRNQNISFSNVLQSCVENFIYQCLILGIKINQNNSHFYLL